MSVAMSTLLLVPYSHKCHELSSLNLEFRIAKCASRDVHLTERTLSREKNWEINYFAGYVPFQ